MTAELPLVLVVEDEPKMRRLLRVTLESNGMRYAEAVTAREALSKAQGQSPDVLIADLGLPDGDGIDVIRGIRRWSSVPVIVLSARSQEADKVAALDAGADDYVIKPFATAELLARLRVALRHGDLHGRGAVAGADAGADAEAGVGVDGDGEGGAEGRRVQVRLRVQAELVALVAGERQTDGAPAVGEDEVHRRRGHLLGGVDEVALIFPVFVVDQDNGFAGLQFIEDFGDRGERHIPLYR